MIIRHLGSILCIIFLCGCGSSESPEAVESTATNPETTIEAEQSDVSEPSSDSSNPDYEQIFESIVKGAIPNATEAEQEAGWQVLETIETFSPEQNKAFLSVLQNKLSDPSPYVKMKAAFYIAITRVELGTQTENKDLIPVFVELLQHEDVMVKRFSLIDVAPVVGQSQLTDELGPLVKPLIGTLENSPTTYGSIVLLGEMGPVAKEAVDAIRTAAEREGLLWFCIDILAALLPRVEVFAGWGLCGGDCDCCLLKMAVDVDVEDCWLLF